VNKLPKDREKENREVTPLAGRRRSETIDEMWPYSAVAEALL